MSIKITALYDNKKNLERELQNESQQQNRQQSRTKRLNEGRKKFNENAIEIRV